MRLPHFFIITSLVLIAPHLVRAQVAGSTLIGRNSGGDARCRYRLERQAPSAWRSGLQ
jgi:hypothetical protein